MTLLSRTRLTLDPLAFSSANLHRAPGVHLTDVIRDMMRMSGVGKQRDDSPESRTALNAYALQGYLWEDAMTETLVGRVRRSEGAAIGHADQYVRLPEIATNGREAFYLAYDDVTGELLTPIPYGWIVMTADGLIVAVTLGLLECKWTTKSVPPWSDDPQVRLDVLSKWLAAHRPDWLWQAPCYLKGLSLVLRENIRLVRWCVMFACGDYKGSGPVYEWWERVYSDVEVEDKWSAVYQHATDQRLFG